MRRLTIAWLIALALSAPAVGVRAQADTRSGAAIKAAYLFNFAKFLEWPSRDPAGPIVLCVMGDSRVARELGERVRERRIADRPLLVSEVGIDGPLHSCHVLFISQADVRGAKAVLAALKTQPVLTVSDSRGFARSGGIVEFFLDSERMRFAVNRGALERAGLRLSSRLLALARIDEDEHAR